MPTVRRKKVTAKKVPTKKVPTKTTGRKVVVKRKPAPTPPPAPTTRSSNPARMSGLEKARIFKEHAEDYDWWAEMKQSKVDNTVTVTLKRIDGDYKETLSVEWNGNRVAKNGVLYTVFTEDDQSDKRTLVVHNVSAANKHIEGIKTLKREVKERRRRPRRNRDLSKVLGGALVGGDYVPPSETDDRPRHTPIGSHIKDKWFDITVTKDTVIKSGKGKRKLSKVICRMENVGSAQIESMRRVWEDGDGFKVNATERNAP